MKKVIVFGLVGMMVMGLAAAASAQVDTNWGIQMKALLNNNTLATAVFGTKSTCNDVYTTTDTDGSYTPGAGTYGYIYSLVSDGTALKQAKADYRAPITTTANAGIENAKVWDLYITGTQAATITLAAWVPSALGIDSTDNIIELWNGDKSTKLFTFTKGMIGTTTSSSTWNYSGTFNFNGADAINLKLLAYTPSSVEPPITPEPGSIVAMLSGLVGLAGFGIRRRK